MVYEYPEIQASLPEATDPVPALSYEYWVITRISNVVNQILEDDPGGAGSKIIPVGAITVRGQKFANNEGIISKVDEETSVTTNALFDFLELSPVFANAYDALLMACGALLNAKDLEGNLIAGGSPDEFSQWLLDLQNAYAALGRYDDAAACYIAREKYDAGEWTQEECLVFLRLVIEPEEAEVAPVAPGPISGPPRAAEPGTIRREVTEAELSAAKARVTP